MKLITTTSKALEYLSENYEGKLDKLKERVSEEQVNMINRSGFLIINNNKYRFTEEGKDVFSHKYFREEYN